MARYLVSLLIIAVVGGCCACGSSTSTSSSNPETVPENVNVYDITIGSGGGVTGNVTGIHVAVNGDVTAWDALANQDANPEYFGTLPLEHRNTLYTIIEEDSLMMFNYAKTGNMTSFLTLKGKGDIHRIRWSGIETDTAAAPIPLRRFITAMNKAYQAIVKP